MVEILLNVLIILPVILISLTVHELAHGYAAWTFGDPTAKYEGRLTLNPLAHLDPIGTLLLLITTVAGYGAMGWAKPVPVVKERLDNPRVSLPLTALAGPISNFIIAITAAVLIHLSGPGILSGILRVFVYVNVGLGLFNCLPIPPLDGFKILLGILPDRTADDLEYKAANPNYIYIGIAAAILLGGYVIKYPFIFLTNILLP